MSEKKKINNKINNKIMYAHYIYAHVHVYKLICIYTHTIDGNI